MHKHTYTRAHAHASTHTQTLTYLMCRIKRTIFPCTGDLRESIVQFIYYSTAIS